MKTRVALAVSERVQDGQTIGLGSGTTVEFAVKFIGEKIEREKLTVYAIATSRRIAEVADRAGIRVLSSFSNRLIDWAFDGADEVDPHLNLIKGRGAAMLSEKIMACRARGRFLIIVTEEKLVPELGSKCAIPVEFIPEAQHVVEAELYALGAKQVIQRLASNKYGPIITESGNHVFDAAFDRISVGLEKQLKSIIGVVESGLFIGYTTEVLVATHKEILSRKLTDDGHIEERVL